MNPLLWSHYADKHKGICLGFEVPSAQLLEVTYEAGRLEVDMTNEFNSTGALGYPLMERFLTTKFAAWEYENEVRMLLNPQQVLKEKDLEFFTFNDNLKLKRVIVGPRSKLTRKQVYQHLCAEEQNAEIIATRIAFKSFHVIKHPIKP